MIEMKAFLKAKGLTSHPFNTFDADKEKDLGQFVVLPPYFESVFGMAEDPQAFLVLGMRGFGKTTLRKMLTQRIEDQYSGRIFCVDYSNFPFTKQKELKDVVLRDHMMEIFRLMALEFSKLLSTSPTSRKRLKVAAKEFLFHLFEIHLKDAEKQELYPKLQSFMEKLLRTYPKKQGRGLYLTPETPDSEVIERSVHTMDCLAGVLKGLGFVSAYVFIDRLDETNRTMKEPDKAGILLGPLISSLEVIQRDFYAFKFFVPAECVNNLKASGFRNDKVQNQTISWTDEKLAEVLKKRIMAFNKEGRMFGKLGTICEEEIKDKVDEFIVMKANKSPRNLLRFCNAIFSEHIEAAQAAEDPISKKIVALALKKYEYSLQIDQHVSKD